MNAAQFVNLDGRVALVTGAPDILVNNAGVATVRGLDELDEAEFDRTLRVNFKSAFLCTQAVLPAMRARRWGRIVNLSSVAAALATDFLARIPVGRIGTPDEVAHAVIATIGNGFITGQVIPVNGGLLFA